jgi:hypothetical protein
MAIRIIVINLVVAVFVISGWFILAIDKSKDGDYSQKEKSERMDDAMSMTINIIQVPEKEYSGLELSSNNKWVIVEDSGKIFEDDVEKYTDSSDFEGIAFCNGYYYVLKEHSDEIVVLNDDFKVLDKIYFSVGSGNTGAEGIACYGNGLFVTAQGSNIVYEIGYDGKLIDSFELTHKDLSGADYYDGRLYVLSDKDNMIMVVENKKVIEEIAIGRKGEWEGIKVKDRIIYVIEDDE